MPDKVSNRIGPSTMARVRNVVDRSRAEGLQDGDGGYGRPSFQTDTEDAPAIAVCADHGKQCFTAEAINSDRQTRAALHRLVRRHYDDTGHTIEVTTVRTMTETFF